ncbi:hypothetical protein ACROYT_G028172 [Oculina patagonica]
MASLKRKGGGGMPSKCCSCWLKVWCVLKQDILLFLIVVGVVIGFIIGAAVNPSVNDIEDPEEKATTIMLIGFPGELFMNMLKLLILPLIVASLICALATLDSKATGKIGRRTVLYYLTTTLLAVILGIVLVVSIRPGESGDKGEAEETRITGPHRNLDSFLDLIRSCFPKNIVEATFRQKNTKYKSVPAKIESYNKTVNVSALHPNGTTKVYNNGTHDYVTVTKEIYPGSDTIPDGQYIASEGGMNVLGLVVFSIVFGIVLGRMGDKGLPLKAFFETLNEVVMKMVTLVMWYSPIGICSMIAAKLAAMADILDALRLLGMFMVTVIVGLLIHVLVVLPIIFVAITRKNPYKFMRGLREAMVTAFGTDSSSATLPTTMRCVEEKNGIDRRISRFVLPLGATVNMDGTALYEGVSAIWIAQLNRIPLAPGQIVTTVLTATAAAIGAAGIPSAGLVTMIIVLQAVNLPTEDIGLILAIDWFLDRFRTCVNVMGDALGAGIVDHLSRDDIKFSELDTNEDTPLKHNGGALDEEDQEEEDEEDDPLKMTSV